jgi:hypothetical protein
MFDDYSHTWYIKFPTDAYALGPVRFKKAVDEQAVRAYARDFDGCKRLPAGFECWPTSD